MTHFDVLIVLPKQIFGQNDNNIGWKVEQISLPTLIKTVWSTTICSVLNWRSKYIILILLWVFPGNPILFL